MSATVPAPTLLRPILGPVRVLHVEDDDAHARLVRELVTEAGGGFDITRADTIAAAESALQRASFDAILLDLRLPDGRGVEAFDRVTRAAGSTPVVILSSLSDERLAVESVGAGAEDYLVKDQVSPETLTRALRHAIRRRSRATDPPGGPPHAVRSPSPSGSLALIGASTLVLEALASGLVDSPELTLLGTFPDVGELVRRIGLGAVDLVVVETGLISELGDLRAIRDQLPASKLVLLADTTASHLRTVLDGEADGLVLTSNTARQVVDSLAEVLAGTLVLPGGWRALESEGSPGPPVAGLSRRQNEILELLAEGHSNEDIAAELLVSINTVKYHVRTLYGRLGIHNRVQAARLLSEARAQG